MGSQKFFSGSPAKTLSPCGASIFLAAGLFASLPESLAVHAVVLGAALGARVWTDQARNAQLRDKMFAEAAIRAFKATGRRQG